MGEEIIKKMKKWKSKNLSWIFVLQGFMYLYHRGVRLPLSLHFPSHKFLAFGSFSRRFVCVHFYLHLTKTLRQNPDLLTAPHCNCTPVQCYHQIWCLVTLSICASRLIIGRQGFSQFYWDGSKCSILEMDDGAAIYLIKLRPCKLLEWQKAVVIVLLKIDGQNNNTQSHHFAENH